MAGDRLERRVEEAERATGTVVAHGQQVDKVAPPSLTPEQQRLREATQTASDSVQSLFGAQGARVRGILDDPEVRHRLNEEMSRLVTGLRVNRYAEAAKGHEVPLRVFRTPQEARQHSQEVVEADQRVLEKRRDEGRKIDEETGFFGRLWNGIKSVGRAIQRGLAAVDEFIGAPFRYVGEVLSGLIHGRPERHAEDIATNWMTSDYLGPVVGQRFANTPPVLTVENRSSFRTIDESDGAAGHLGYGSHSIGRYYPGTNHVMVAEEIRGHREADIKCIIAHEELHYASWLGGGEDIRWQDETGNPIIQGYVSWIHEGLTEFHAQELTRAHGFEPSHVAYPYETIASSYLQQLVGADTLKQAYLTGDFTDVRRIVDQRLGEGTFDILLGARDVPNDFNTLLHHSRIERGSEALTFLVVRLEKAGISTSEWDRNPIVARARQEVGGRIDIRR